MRSAIWARFWATASPASGQVIESDALDLCRETAATAPRLALDTVRFLPPVRTPDKILCVGVNYRDRNAEYKDGTDAPAYPSLFMRTRGSLVGHGEPGPQTAGIRSVRL